ncbi:MAG: hypothetical protein G4V63_27645 [Candidatus Afipia apatlaquensis]|uniref:Uncharacterized protein n=1 Tax=Candidatus Afipia apatlaquensis TaxID=2712852 RepID=A0A7C9RK26_9BRAD|nr:hypothetical protein [Candidatus Afipia apatlaquensis]
MNIYESAKRSAIELAYQPAKGELQAMFESLMAGQNRRSPSIAADDRRSYAT